VAQVPAEENMGMIASQANSSTQVTNAALNNEHRNLHTPLQQVASNPTARILLINYFSVSMKKLALPNANFNAMSSQCFV
jgi:hypothetical protein